MKNGQPVTIGGVIVARQHPPTANGVCFLAVEDADGIVNVVVMPDIYARDRTAAHGVFVVVKGVVQWDGGAIHVVAKALAMI